MRYPAGHKEATHAKILKAAAKVFRKKGFAKATVEDVMAEAKLTVGGFYAHFDSKEALFSEMLLHAAGDAADRLQDGTDAAAGPEQVGNFVRRYLSTLHRKFPDKGCPIPPLLSEMTRAKGAPKRSFQAVVERMAGRLARYLNPENPTAAKGQALAIVATCVGGIAMARAVSDEDLAEEILAACRDLALATLPEKFC